jgi:hypothetical protein
VRQRQRVPARKNHGPLDDVLQLADVAGPRQPGERVEHGGGDHPDVLAVAPREALDEVPREQRDVLPPVPQRRNGDREDVQAIVQVGAKLAPLHHLPDVLVGGRDHPHVHGGRPPAAPEPLDLLVLQRPQQLWLQLERQIADLVEKQGAAMRGLESPRVCARAPVNAPRSYPNSARGRNRLRITAARPAGLPVGVFGSVETIAARGRGVVENRVQLGATRSAGRLFLEG